MATVGQGTTGSIERAETHLTATAEVAGMTEIRDLVREFGERTLSNLNFVQAHADRPDVYEITQLWNSLSGLLVLPYEHEVDEIKATLAEAVDRGWPQLSETFPLDDAQSASNDLADQVRRLRNAVSHYNVRFLSRQGKITKVRVWNHQLPPRGSGISQREMPINWQTEIPTAQLNQLARATATLYAAKLRYAA